MPRRRVTPIRKPRRVKRAIEVVTLRLKYRHDINGIVYGPGEVKVGRGLGDVLMENESNCDLQEAIFRGTRAAIIGPRTRTGHTTRFVAPESFETAHENAMPIERISGQNLNDTGSGPGF